MSWRSVCLFGAVLFVPIGISCSDDEESSSSSSSSTTSTGTGGTTSSSTSSGTGGSTSSSTSTGTAGSGGDGGTAQGGGGHGGMAQGGGGQGGSTCDSCFDLLHAQGTVNNLCTDGQPSSSDLWTTLYTCVCTTSCSTQCANSLCAGLAPQGQCNSCINQSCSNERTDCTNDT